MKATATVTLDLQVDPLTDAITEMLAMFEIASRIRGASITLFELQTPGAAYALRLWCSARNVRLQIERNAANKNCRYLKALAGESWLSVCEFESSSAPSASVASDSDAVENVS